MDVTLLFQIAIIGIIATTLNMVMKQAGKEEFGVGITISAFALIMVKVIYEVAQLFTTIRTMFQF